MTAEVVKWLCNKQDSSHKFCHSQGAKGQKVHGVHFCLVAGGPAGRMWFPNLSSLPLPTKQTSLIQHEVICCHQPSEGTRCLRGYGNTSGICVVWHPIWHSCSYSSEKQLGRHEGWTEPLIVWLAGEEMVVDQVAVNIEARTELLLRGQAQTVVSGLKSKCVYWYSDSYTGDGNSFKCGNNFADFSVVVSWTTCIALYLWKTLLLSQSWREVNINERLLVSESNRNCRT